MPKLCDYSAVKWTQAERPDPRQALIDALAETADSRRAALHMTGIDRGALAANFQHAMDELGFILRTRQNGTGVIAWAERRA